MTYPNTPEGRARKKIRDIVYNLRHREYRLQDSRRRAMFPEQVIYRALYGRYRMAVKGRKLAPGELFNKPGKLDRLKLYELKKFGCKKCGANDNLEIDHIDSYPNNNCLSNLQWLCNTCHQKKTFDEKYASTMAKYEELAKLPLYSHGPV